MAESFTHAKLVKELNLWINNNYSDIIIFADTYPYNYTDKPPNIGGFVPDIYGKSLSGKMVIVGEAKTKNDLENIHTFDQIKAFLKYCSYEPLSLFILIVPWDMIHYAHNLINRLLRELDIDQPISFKIICPRG